MADSTKFYVMRGDKVLFESMTKEEIYSAIVQAIEQGEIGDIDTGFVTKIKETNRDADLKFWRGTQAEYNALEAVDPTTYYILTDAPGHTHLIFENDLQITGKLTVDNKIQANNRINAAENVVVEGDITGRRGITAQGQLLAQNNARFELASVFEGKIEVDTHGAASPNFKIKNSSKYISVNFDEMLWQPLTLETGITAGAYGGYSKPMFRKVGDRVDIVGSVNISTFPTGSTPVTIGTLDEGFRPATGNNHVFTAAMPGYLSDARIAKVRITDAGKIQLDWAAKLADGSAPTSGALVYLETSFFILDSNNVIDNS